jgi:CheY-like chemotaxis protein
VVLDLKLPGMGGVEVLKRLKQEFPDVPVLLITGHSSPTNDGDAPLEGVHDFLVKPVQLEELIRKMREAVKGE